MTMQQRRKRRTVRPAQIAKAIDEGRESLDLYLDEISKVPLLSREEEMELARKAFRGNVLAQEKLARVIGAEKDLRGVFMFADPFSVPAAGRPRGTRRLWSTGKLVSPTRTSAPAEGLDSRSSRP